MTLKRGENFNEETMKSLQPNGSREHWQKSNREILQD